MSRAIKSILGTLVIVLFNLQVTLAEEVDPLADVSGFVVDQTIFASIQLDKTTGETSTCRWSPSLARDSGQGQSYGTPVTKIVGNISFRLYDRCCPEVTFHWIAEVSTEVLASRAASIAYDHIPAPFGEFAPPADSGLVNVPTWFWVHPFLWRPVVATAWIPSPQGPIMVTTTATPTELKFDPGDGPYGAGTMSCPGPGMIWFSIFGDSMPSDCMYTYSHSSSLNSSGLFDASLSIEWKIAWTSTTGVSGTLPSVTTTSAHQMRIREFQALVTS